MATDSKNNALSYYKIRLQEMYEQGHLSKGDLDDLLETMGKIVAAVPVDQVEDFNKYIDETVQAYLNDKKDDT